MLTWMYDTWLHIYDTVSETTFYTAMQFWLTALHRSSVHCQTALDWLIDQLMDLLHLLLMVGYMLALLKNTRLVFLSNLVKNQPIWIIFGTQNPEEYLHAQL